MHKKGDVIYTYLGKINQSTDSLPTSVQKKRRPCVIVNDILSEEHTIFIVSPVTRQLRRNFPFVQEIQLQYKSYIHYEQFFTVPADHTSPILYSLNEREIKEMFLKSSFCLGTYKANILNIREISSIVVCFDKIFGKIIYNCGMPQSFSLDLSRFEVEFGKCNNDQIISEKLSSLNGLKLILNEGGIML